MVKKETCWSCGLDLIVGEVVHNDTGGDSILCKCGATTVPMIEKAKEKPGPIPVVATSPAEEKPAPTKKPSAKKIDKED